MADGEVYVGFAIGSGVERAFYEVLFHWRARPVFILVECQHAFGQLTVVKTVGAEHIGCHGFVVAFGYECFDAFALVLLAHFVKLIIEREVLDTCEIFLLEVRGWLGIVRVHEGEHILKHTACRS